MEQKLQALENFAIINSNQYMAALLKLIRSIAHKHNNGGYNGIR